jgi:tetratricopeptide (TPR) repeat protein
MSHLPAFTPPPPPGLDIPVLLEVSRPRGGLRGLRPSFVMPFLAVSLVVMLLPINPAAKGLFQMLLWMSFLGVVAYLWNLVRAFRQESRRLDEAEDLLVLKRVYDVVPRLHWLMSKPMQAEQNRLRAMVLLATALARLQRPAEALLIYNELIEVERIAGPGGVMVKLGRVMAMLQSDHLYDADRAINDLRRLIDRGGAESEMAAMDQAMPSGAPDPITIAALRLVEIYRDVKTGHSEEAIALFRDNLQLLRQGLSHRVGEAHALVAIAYDRLGDGQSARERFADATNLQPIAELLQRYPELRPLPALYPPTPAPRLY